ncbi:MAG: carbohydrate binding domain-containing protein, partial [Oscillospiraceae bacterium]|nr:carbohydrate binding domain-containing protein [Oscillospiraceae bacterium]
FATPWEPPANLAESGGKLGKLHIPRSNYGAYAQHLNNFGNYMKSQGVDLYSISVQNEPDYASEWTGWTTDETTDFLANYADKITSAKVMSPESFQYAPENVSWVADGGKKYYTKILNNSKAFANCDLFGTHFYGTQRGWMDFPALENCGKEIWMTEVYVPNSEADSANRFPEALDVSENIHNGLVVGNMSAYVWWYIRRSYCLLTEDGKISKRGYCMAQYSKFVRPGDIRIDATESPEKNVYISAYKNSKNQVIVVAVNKGDNGYAQQFSLAKGESITDVDRWRTSSNENLALTENLEYNGSSFFAQLPAKSVSTFVISTNGTAGPQPTEAQPATEAQPDANGYYFHDTFEDGVSDWKGHGASDISLSGRQPYAGSEAAIIQHREKTWNGAEKALNSNVFKAGNTYSFSANMLCLDSDQPSETFALTLQYTGTDGETHFASIARAETATGNWVQLANQNFKIPEGATNCILYAETANTTSNFYLDEIIGAKAGVAVNGPAPVAPTEAPTEPPTTEAPTELPTQPTTTEPTEPPTQPTTAEPTEQPTTEAPTEPPTQPTTAEPTEPPTQPTTATPTEQPTQPATELVQEIKYGDVNLDGEIDILDVITLNKAVMGKEILNDQQNKNADVNKNGSPDANDSLMILKYIVGMITDF